MVYYTHDEFVKEFAAEKSTKSYTWLAYSIGTAGALITAVVLGFCDIMKTSENEVCEPIVTTTCDIVLIVTVIYLVLSFYCSQIVVRVNKEDDSKSKEVKKEEDRQSTGATSFNIYQLIKQPTKSTIKARKPSYDTRIITSSEDLDELYIERNHREEREDHRRQQQQQQQQQNHHYNQQQQQYGNYNQNQNQNTSKQQYLKYLKPYTKSLTTTIWKYIPSMSLLK